MKSSSPKKALLSLVTGMCIITMILPLRASAQWVVLDPTNLVQAIIRVAQGIQQIFFANQSYLKEYVLDVVQKGIATNIERRIIDSTLNWARNGFDGNPSFVVNPRDLLLGVEGNEALLFSQQINQNIGNICSPFQNSVRTAISQASIYRSQNTSRSPAETIRITQCNLNNLVTSGVIDNYYQPGGFATEGGYAPMLQAIYNQADNSYEIGQLATELQQQRQGAAALQQQSLITGGSLPKSKCVDPGPGAFPCNRYENDVPSGNVSDLVSKMIGHSVDEISGQDEILESVFAAVIERFTNRVIQQGLR